MPGLMLLVLRTSLGEISFSLLVLLVLHSEHVVVDGRHAQGSRQLSNGWHDLSCKVHHVSEFQVSESDLLLLPWLDDGDALIS